MKGEKRLKILEFLENSAQLIDDTFFIFSLPYGTSYSRMSRLLQNRKSSNFPGSVDKKNKRHFDDIMYRLKKEGLVSETKKENRLFLGVTGKGKNILEKLRSNRSNELPNYRYKKENEKTLKIVIFDISEQERRKRSWLRSALKNLKFDMLQKSVWAGKSKLPCEFMEDLKRLNLLESVEIFAISKGGSLKHL